MAYLTAEELFSEKGLKEGLTYEDFLVKPTDAISFGTDEIDLETRLTKNLSLRLGIVGSPMDTVMNAKIGIALALEGGIGCLHFNYGSGKKGLERAIKEGLKIKDFKFDKNKFQDATIDKDGRLKVLMALESYDSSIEKINAFIQNGLTDGIIIDTSMISTFELKLIGKIKDKCPQLDIISGNYCHADQISFALDFFGSNKATEYLDCFRVGVGPGQTCDLQKRLGTGRPNASSVYECAKIIKDFGGYTMADGGLYDSGIFKAFVIGTNTVMLGTAIGATKEAPGKKDKYGNKIIRGMGSEKAMKKGGEKRYQFSKVPLGQEGKIQVTKSIYEFLDETKQYLLKSFQYNGSRSILELHSKLYANKPMFEKLSERAKKATDVYGLLTK